MNYLLSDVYGQDDTNMIKILTQTKLTKQQNTVKDEKYDDSCHNEDNKTDHVNGCCLKYQTSLLLILHSITSTNKSKRGIQTQKNTILIRHLCKFKHDIDCFNSFDEKGWNALHCICGNTMVSCLEFIYRAYQNSIDWNVPTRKKWKGTPLMIALTAHDSGMKVDCIRFLANVNYLCLFMCN